mgnify:CR=1 FL=1
MKNRLLKHLPAKIIALLAACVLWLHVATEQTYEHTYKFTLILGGLPDEYVLGSPLPDSVSAVLKGRGKDLIKLYVADGEVVIDASGFKYTEKFMDLSEAELRLPEKNIELVEYLRKEPVRLLVDRYIDREVPVENNLVLVPADGYTVIEDSVSFEPPRVIVGGPEREVRVLTYVETRSETLRNLNAPTNAVVDMKPPGKLLDYTPKKVTAYIDVEPLVKKELGKLEIKLQGGQLGPDEELSASRVDIVFSGSRADMDSLRPEEVEVLLDYRRLQGSEHGVRPVVIHPQELEIVTISPEIIRILPAEE